jgi:aspartyl-tRNA(Asn)/glutamyl-tRNA(Gln) amidotransferase subunit A
MSAALHQRGVAELGRALAEGECSSVELTQTLLARAAEHDRCGAFLATHAESALAQARAADALRARGLAGR